MSHLYSPHDLEGKKDLTGWVFDIQRYSINDGPGIRTTVFFKGCPLTCLWCSNPESHHQPPQLFYFDSLCSRCYRCVTACPTRATTINGPDGGIQIDRGLCGSCGLCAEACLSEARVISGRLMKLDEVLEVVKKDVLFYRNSGGGVTASGGEPTSQPKFLLEFFRRCQESNIHTTLDTCGYTSWEILKEILEYTELVLFDIKHMDSERHKGLTGVDSKQILENAERIVQQGKPTKIRFPLIPGCNNSGENIRAAADFVARLGLGGVDLLLYHQLGKNKYKRLGKAYELEDTGSYREEDVVGVRQIFESCGIEVHIA